MNWIGHYDVNGKPPALAGRVCEGFICEAYRFEGELISSANVTYLKFHDIWHRLYFEPCIVFWREAEEPKPFEVPEEAWACPHTDVGALAGIIGEKLDHYETQDDDTNLSVTFYFANRLRIRIGVSRDDISSYAVLPLR